MANGGVCPSATADTCTTCQTGYYMFLPTSKLCQACDLENCYDCTATTAAPGRTCISNCQDKKCSKCWNSPAICELCEKGWYMVLTQRTCTQVSVPLRVSG